MVVLTSGIVRLLPIGVFALITRMVGTTGFESFGPLIWYFLTVAAGLTVHLFVTLPLAPIVLARISPAIHFKNLRNPLLIAFSTSSAAATLPVTMRTADVGREPDREPLQVRFRAFSRRRRRLRPREFLLARQWGPCWIGHRSNLLEKSGEKRRAAAGAAAADPPPKTRRQTHTAATRCRQSPDGNRARATVRPRAGRTTTPRRADARGRRWGRRAASIRWARDAPAPKDTAGAPPRRGTGRARHR